MAEPGLYRAKPPIGVNAIEWTGDDNFKQVGVLGDV
jgi:hypothetical protein